MKILLTLACGLVLAVSAQAGEVNVQVQTDPAPAVAVQPCCQPAVVQTCPQPVCHIGPVYRHLTWRERHAIKRAARHHARTALVPVVTTCHTGCCH